MLTTGRLKLRPVTAADGHWLHDHWTAPEVRRFLFDGTILAPSDIVRVIDDSTRDFAATGHGLWLIHQPSTTQPLGTAGLRPLDDLGLEVTYSLAPSAWGNGYATEAAAAVIDYAFGPLGLPQVLAEIDEGNAASIAVVERLGMTPFDVVPGLLGPMTRYRKTAG